MSSTANTASVRYHYLDWVRVIGMLAVFVFHGARFFDHDDWHVKSSVLSEGLTVWAIFLSQWIMPLMFVVSGVSTFLALRNRSTGKFIADRAARLLIPLILGIFTHVAFQVYLERLTHGQFQGTFFDFYPHYFNGLYLGNETDGNFAWMGLHLWYLLILFLLSMLALPLFNYWKREDVQANLTASLAFLGRPGAIFLLALPVALVEAIIILLDADLRAFGGWNPFLYLIFLFYGFLIMARPPLERAVRSGGVLALIGGLVTTSIGLVVVIGDIDPGLVAGEILRGLNSWLWILAIIGLCARWLDRSNPALAYANEALLPFYILHQSVMLPVGYLLLSLPLAPLALYVLILAVSFPIIMGLYDLLIRRFNVLRLLFGMKPLPDKAPPVPAASD